MEEVFFYKLLPSLYISELPIFRKSHSYYSVFLDAGEFLVGYRRN
jgi:hypothetical protein